VVGGGREAHRELAVNSVSHLLAGDRCIDLPCGTMLRTKLVFLLFATTLFSACAGLPGPLARRLPVTADTPQGLFIGVSGTGAQTTVSWSTGNGSVGDLYVAQEGGPEQLFANGSSGSKAADWVVAGRVYEFHLYAGTDHATRLAMIRVFQQ
jgi:hypothetical protein